MSGNKWKQSKIIDEKDMNMISDFAKYMVINLGYYFWDKKAGKEVDKFEIYATFSKEYSGRDELEDVYAGIQVRYERRKK